MSWFKKLLGSTTANALGEMSGHKLATPAAWIAERAEVSIADFLSRAKFSNTNQVTRTLSSDNSIHQIPHYWIITPSPDMEIDEDKFTEEGETLVSSLEENVKGSSDPAQLYSQFNKSLSNLCLETGLKSGKFIFNIPEEKITESFEKVATSLVEGELSRTSAHTLKTSTIMRADNFEMNLICGSVELAELTQMTQILVNKLNVTPAGYELDANILLDVTSRTGIPSPRHKISDLLKDRV